jgi:hypothetical protein
LVESDSKNPFVYAQAFVTRDGQRKLLLINKRDRSFDIEIAGAKGGSLAVVDQKTIVQPAKAKKLGGDRLTIEGLAVVVVTLPGNN